MVEEAKNQGEVYEQLADILSFPKENIKDATQGCLTALRGSSNYPEDVVKEITEFEKSIADLTLDDLQGIYSHTFELTSDYTMDLGYYLFEGFKRTNFLVSLKGMYKANKFPYDAIAKGELPDNLVVILRFMAGLKDGKLKNEFRETIVIKALEKLAKNFETKNDEFSQYKHVIRAVMSVVDTDVKQAA